MVHAHQALSDLLGGPQWPSVPWSELSSLASRALGSGEAIIWEPRLDRTVTLHVIPSPPEHVFIKYRPLDEGIGADSSLLEQLLDTAPDAMVIVGEHGRIVRVNARTEQVFGHHRQELIGRPVEVLIPAASRKAHEGHRGNFFASPHTRMMGSGLELFGLHKDGHEFPVEVSLGPLETPDGMLVSAAIRDITERKRVEQQIRDLNKHLEARVEERTAALLRSEERFHEALDGMMEGVQLIDREWRYTYMNDAAVAQSRYTREQLIGRTMMECYPGIEDTPMFGVLKQCFEDGQQRVLENMFHFPNGELGVFELRIRPTQDHLFILSTDISARKKAEQELAQQSERLKRQNQELEQFAYIASHDLQEPLRMVTSYVELLERRYADKLDDDAREFIAFAVDGTRRMKRLIQDLLMFSRAGRDAEYVPVDLDQVFREVCRNLGNPIASHGASVTADRLPTVQAVRTGMVQLFQNLISNGIKFHRPGVPPIVHVGVSDEGREWRLTFTDNGIGIDMRFAAQVFAPFKRLQAADRYSGSGIGLAVAKKVVTSHGGRISIEPTPGPGSTFVVFLPKHHY
jgi:PAS domain S-box-containing protein